MWSFFIETIEAHMNSFDRITSDPARMNGQPCIRNLRLTVRRVIELLSVYPDRQELRREFPELEDEDIRQALNYAAANLEDKIIERAAS
jgi:uncharacterized protein (DUF433 family)